MLGHGIMKPTDRRWIGSYLVLALLFATHGHVAAAEQSLKDSNGYTVTREFLGHRDDSSKRIEVYWAKPSGPAPWPTVVLIHGHQTEKDAGGGKVYLTYGTLGRLAENGYLVLSVSQPGYGGSDGPADFCGPFTQDAVYSVIEHFVGSGQIAARRVAIYGVSRGAIVAGLVAARYASQVRAVVLQSGAYDLSTAYPTQRGGLNRNIEKEAGTSAEAFETRSLIPHADKLDAAVLIVHGENDQVFPVEQATTLRDTLTSLGLPVETEIVEGAGHNVRTKALRKMLMGFLAEHLK